MKRLFLTFTVVGICLITTGQVPKSFNYQTIIRKASGEVMAAKKVSLKFSILPDVTVAGNIQVIYAVICILFRYFTGYVFCYQYNRKIILT